MRSRKTKIRIFVAAYAKRVIDRKSCKVIIGEKGNYSWIKKRKCTQTFNRSGIKK